MYTLAFKNKILTIFFVLIILKTKHYRYKTEQPQEFHNALLIFAHPDDELMFFTPTLQNLSDKITILCLSTGNYYNQGIIRKKEIQKICKILNINLQICERFSDNENWCLDDIKNLIKFLDDVYKFDVFFTFDAYGVSGHKNHIACYNGLREFAMERPIVAYALESVGFLKKYIFRGTSDCDLSFNALSFIGGVTLMLNYKSQMMWFRYLYLLFSNYMLLNNYSRIII